MAKQNWTAADVPDLSGKRIVVTGANSGIGYEACKVFAAQGAEVIMACRNPQKAATALAALNSAVPDANVTVMDLDLASQASVQAFADAFNATYESLDVLVNNAGIMMVPYGQTEDGYERQLGTNHLGHFALTGLLLDALKAAPESRVVNISSGAHQMGNMDFDNLMYAAGKDYTPLRAYGRSKLANLLFTYELQKRFEAHNINCQALAAHPGGSNTNLGNHLADGIIGKIMMPIMRLMMQGADMGALPTLRAAVDPDAVGRDYFGPSGIMEMTGYPKKTSSNSASHNADHQRQLWEVSEQLTGVKYL